MSRECIHLYSKDFMCFLVFIFFLIGLPLSFVSSKILVYNTKLRIKGLIKLNTTLKTTFDMLNSQHIEISRLFVSIILM
jgi:hypothetical protein